MLADRPGIGSDTRWCCTQAHGDVLWCSRHVRWPWYTNGYGKNITMGGAFFLEVVLTALFVFAILMVTDKWAVQSLAGVAIGMSLVAVHIIGIPLDGTSVNPARSIGPALFEGGTALSQLWLFIVAPLIGGLVAAGLWAITRDTSATDDDKALSDVRRKPQPPSGGDY